MLKALRSLVVVISVFGAGCSAPSIISWSAVRDSVEALAPYTVAGIEASPVSAAAKAELLREVEELRATIALEVRYAR